MKVMVLIRATPSSEAGGMPSEQLLAEMGRYNEELAHAGILLDGAGLRPSSAAARILFSGTQRHIVAGPFTETRELIAGFWMWRVASWDEALAWAQRCPQPMPEECEIELRQVAEAEDFGTEFTPTLREQEAGVLATTLGLGSPEFCDAPERPLAGLNHSYTMDNRGEIPAQWDRFISLLPQLPGRTGETTYGVCWNSQANCDFDYLTGIEILPGEAVKDPFVHLTIPAGRYAVFTHAEHVSRLPQKFDRIWSKWVPDCGLRIAKSPCFEQYTPEFDPQTGLGGTTIWIPLESSDE